MGVDPRAGTVSSRFLESHKNNGSSEVVWVITTKEGVGQEMCSIG